MVITMNKFSQNDLVHTPNDGIVTVIKQNGISVETSNGKYHHTKLTKVNMIDGIIQDSNVKDDALLMKILVSQDDLNTQEKVSTERNSTKEQKISNDLNSSKKVTKRSIATELRKQNPDMDRKQLMELFVKELNVTKANSSVYADFIFGTGRYAEGKK